MNGTRSSPNAGRSRGAAARALAGAGLVLALALPPSSPASAHGPTVKVSYGRVSPALVVLRPGETVHFHNANAAPGTCTVVAEDGSFRSPPLERAEGWHYTFQKPGRFAFSVEGYPRARGEVVVAEP